MNAANDRKQMLRLYKEEKVIGGVYALRNKVTGTQIILSTTTISKAENALAFSRMTGSCVHPLLADEWKTHGPDAFECVILETLEKKPEQTEAEFRDEVKELEGMRRGE